MLKRAKKRMKIHMIPIRFELTEAIRAFAALKLSHLDVITDAVCGAAVVLSQEPCAQPGERFTAKVHLAVPGKDVHAEETSSDIYAAIDGVQSKLARQLRKRKTRLRDGATRRTQRARERLKFSGVG
jgi:putative sigma-54 modulation protein